MKKPVWEFRIPTIVALLAVTASIWVTGMLVKNGTFVVGHASPDTAPQHVTVTNITDTTATVVFVTTSAASAAVKLSDGKTADRVVFQNNQQAPLTTHQIAMSDLAPQSRYTYSLVIEGKTYSDPTYSFTTGPQLASSNTSQTISGTLLSPSGHAANDALIVLETPDSQLLSTASDTQGNFSFNLSVLRTKDLSASQQITDDTVFTLNAYSADQHSVITTRFDNSQQLPNILLSQDYDFTQQSTEVSTSSAQTTFVLPSPIISQSSGLSITTPKNGSSTIDSQPVLRGTGTKGAAIQISISPANIKGTVTVDTNEHWQFRPTTSLPQGANTLTITSLDTNGVKRAVTSSFTVFPSGSQIAQSATPSATLTPSPTAKPTVTISPTPTITSAPTPTPTASTTVTPTPTTVVTIAPTATPTIFTTPTPTPFISVTPPPTGNVSALLISLTSVILIVTGTTLLFIL